MGRKSPTIIVSSEGDPTPEMLASDKPEPSTSPLLSPTADHHIHQSHRPALKTKRNWTFCSPKERVEDSPIEPAGRNPALYGESIASRHKFDTAYIECNFYKIEYGQFRGRPACLVIVDLRLVYQPRNTLKEMEIKFQFRKDSARRLSYKDSDQKSIQTIQPPDL